MYYTKNKQTGIHKAWITDPHEDSTQQAVAVFGKSADMVAIGIIDPVPGYLPDPSEIVVVFAIGDDSENIKTAYHSIDDAKRAIEKRYHK